MRMASQFVCLLVLGAAVNAQTAPGPGSGPPQSGGPLNGMSTSELAIFQQAQDTFNEVTAVGKALGLRLQLDSCAGCPAAPVVGGSSPAISPQSEMATKAGATNNSPRCIQSDGPIRVVGFGRGPDGRPDGGVHDLFVICGRGDAPPACAIQQPDFSQIQNLAFRIPPAVFGLGLVESIPDSALLTNLAANADRKRRLGIQGHFNLSGNDGTITRFGWKAQNKSLLTFAGEAYNLAVGGTNELFPQARDGNADCLSPTSPEDHADLHRD